MCSPINPLCGFSRLVGAAGSHVAGSVFNEVAKQFGSAAAKVTTWMWTVIAQTTTVDLSGGWFGSTLGITATLAGVVIAAIFVLELIKAVLRREPGALGRAAIGVGAGVLGATASIGMVQALLVATDALSDGIVRTAGFGSLDKLGSEIAPTASIAGVAQPALILLLGLGYLLASFFVWAVFIARKAMIIVAAVFAPIAFAGAASRATSGWVRRWVEFTLAMVFSKLVVVVIFTLALSLVGSPGSGLAAVGALFSGLALMVIACFAPWMLFKLVHFIGGDVVAAHHSSLNQTVMAAGATPMAMARTAATRVAGVVGGGAGGTSAAASGGAAASTASAPTLVPVAKSLANNPVIKGFGGAGPADGDGPATPGGPKPPDPPGPHPADPPSGPRPGGPPPRPQPAPMPTGS